MKTKRKAFTLVELLIATAIVTLVVAVAFGANMVVASSVGRVSAAIDDAEISERLVRAIATQMSSMALPKDNAAAGQQIDILRPSAEFAFNSSASRSGVIMAFVSSQPLLDHRIGGYFQVRYRLDPITRALIVSEQPYVPGHGAITQGEVSGIMFSDVVSVSADYFNGEKWHARQRPDEDALPTMIRLHITRLQNGRTIEHRIAAPIFRASGGNVSIEKQM